MASMEEGRRRYRREYGKTSRSRFEAMDDTPMNRGRLRKAARGGDTTARDILDQWTARNGAGFQLDAAPPEPTDVN